MELPKLIDISTQKVVTIHESKTIQEAVDLMYQSSHRDVIVLSEEKRNFGILKANDLVKLKIQGVPFTTKLKEIKYDSVMSVHFKSTIIDAINEINSTCNCICLIDDEDRLCGYVSYYDIVSSVDPQLMLEKRTLSDILISSYVKCANHNDRTFEVIALMDHNIYDSVVIFENNRGVGIITTKDIVKLFGENKDLNLPISAYMSQPLSTLKHTTTISQALEFIQNQHFKRLVIEDHDGNIVGQITQEELIARVYARWADFIKSEKSQLAHVNKVLEARATKLEHLASFDRLTGLYNRSKFELALNEELNRVKRYKTQIFSLVLFDVDNFKLINDTYGHVVGDIVLRDVAELAKKTIRSTDILCRWGGEEFVLIMPMTDLSHGMEAAQKLKDVISGYEFETVGSVTCSFGVTEYVQNDVVQTIINRADKAMYKAKSNGKNRVEWHLEDNE